MPLSELAEHRPGAPADREVFRRLIPAERDAIAALCEEAATWLEGRSLGARAEHSAGLILEELLTNVGKYAYPGGRAGPVEVALRIDGQAVRLRIVDEGRPFDPPSVPPPPSAGSPGARRGGLGLHLVRKVASTFTYGREEDRNVVEATVTGG